MSFQEACPKVSLKHEDPPLALAYLCDHLYRMLWKVRCGVICKTVLRVDTVPENWTARCAVQTGRARKRTAPPLCSLRIHRKAAAPWKNLLFDWKKYVFSEEKRLWVKFIFVHLTMISFHHSIAFMECHCLVLNNGWKQTKSIMRITARGEFPPSSAGFVTQLDHMWWTLTSGALMRSPSVTRASDVFQWITHRPKDPVTIICFPALSSVMCFVHVSHALFFSVVYFLWQLFVLPTQTPSLRVRDLRVLLY